MLIQRSQPDRAERRRAVRLVIALVIAVVVAAVVLGAVLLTRGDPPQDVAGEGRTASTTTQEEPADDDEGASAQDLAGVEPRGATAEPCRAPSGDVPEPIDEPYEQAPSVDLDGVETATAILETTCGTVQLALDAAAAPATVANFVALAEDGYYAGVGFHRVVDGFMVQGGDPTGTGSGCPDEGCEDPLPGYRFDDELELAEEVVEERGGYPRGTVAMANTGPDTNGSQFFIVQGDPGYPLPPQYAVFGEVTGGMDVVDRIAQGPADGQLAIDPTVIRSIEVER